ncbi:hypothetical protein KSF73_11200 [Burkholderiaceae bacterium DAT-1]|nr:hypothetical protein [Burkholderiaceae bacterium DAT-1]
MNPMTSLNLKSLDPAELMPLPDVPDSYGPRDEEEQRIYDLVMEGMSSGTPIPVDDAFFRELDAIIAKS